MSDMLDDLARTIAQAEADYPSKGSAQLAAIDLGFWRFVALAALERLREPDQVLIDRGRMANGLSRAMVSAEVVQVWQAMIDAMLADKPASDQATWQTAPATDLETTIAAFKAEFPGWWFTIGECEKSCDASIAPTRESPDIALIDADDVGFDSGFHIDLPQPSTLAAALEEVMAAARVARMEAARP